VIVGVMGKSGSGKTTIAKQIEARGFFRASLDDIAKDLTPSLLPQIATTFGRQFITPQGELDRKLLGDYVFTFPDARWKLDRIFVDPLWDALRDILKVHKNTVVEGFDLPVGLEPDLLIYVTAPDRILQQRLQQREPGTHPRTILARLKSQESPRTHKAKLFLTFDTHELDAGDIRSYIDYHLPDCHSFRSVARSLNVSERFDKIFAELVTSTYPYTIEQTHSELLEDGTIQVSALVTDKDCDDCLRYATFTITRGPDDDLQVAPPVFARD
jgi:dephospho-CoA kinase